VSAPRLAARDAALTALALAAGFVDGVSYLTLGHVFTANMTGNTVLLGLAVGQGHGADVARSAVALGGFCCGVGGGALVLRERGRAALALSAESLALLLLAALAAQLGTAAGGLRLGLIAVSALAMGLQSATVRKVGVPGVATTYITGTLTGAVATLAERLGSASVVGQEEAATRSLRLPILVWAVYGLGALIGAALTVAWGASALWVAPALVAACAAIGAVRRPQGLEG
jgi:uncharacterized membrane protein YoaK (UPF0700 family)